jgi:hypothetical protein
MPFLRSEPAGQFLKENFGFGTKKALDKLASVGGGPEFHKAGRVRLYTPEALTAWALSKIGPPQTSTAQNLRPEPPARDPARPRGRPRKQAADDASAALEPKSQIRAPRSLPHGSDR